ncbi:MerR family transcriptional regulator [Chromatium okenii]|uniref:MerR family transcriptional regulator n=1 Tax=Chromatium okenii TaxID=61644 RepID=UPI0026F34ECF|nr:MerR family transcriptional regulator [Chromatium okenii]MBV5307944.1 MerR family transcriptional regulator [Chromatium okenii]
MKTGAFKKIGEVVELLGTTPRTLRFYEAEGLISSRRTAGGTRYYSDADIARFSAILRLANAGIPLHLVKTIATTREHYATGAESSHAIHTLLTTLHEQVNVQMALLTQLTADLSFAATTLESCFHCGNAPTRSGCPECLVNQRLDASELLNLIWEQELN